MRSGQSIPEPAAKLEEPQQSLEEERPAQDTGGEKAMSLLWKQAS
jgi:hypothetical protein